MSHVADHPVTAECVLSKHAVIPITLKGNQTYALATGTAKDPMKSAVEVITQPATVSVLDPAFTSPAGLQGPSPAKFSVVVLDGNAKRFRGGKCIVKTADSAGNAAQFVEGVVEDGNGLITSNGNVAVTFTLNGDMHAQNAVSGTQLQVELDWN